MRIVGEYDTSVVHGNGCLGAEVPGKMYIDSGGGTATNLHQADLYAFPTDGYSSSNPPNTPLPKLVFSDPAEGGRSAVFERVAAVSNVDSTGVERADVHALVIRVE